MKPLLFCCLSLPMILMGGKSAMAQAEEAPKEAPKAAPAKQVPNPGRLEIQVTSGEKVKTFDHPSKATKEISQAVTRDKRAKEGEEPVFEAVMTLNDQTFTFTEPERALEACKALTNAMRELPRLKMGLGDLGEIPEPAPDTQPMPNAQGTKPTPPKNQAAAMAIVRQRINLALQRQMLGTGAAASACGFPISLRCNA